MPPGAPFQPSQRPLEGVPCSRHIRPPRHHVIERHRDVGAENPLDLRGALGGERASTAVHVALELDAAFVHATKAFEREHLKADRKSTRLNSSHLVISYAVFCLKKKKKKK